MTTVGYSTLDVIPSVKNLRAQLEQQTSRDFTTAGKRGGEQFGDAAGKAAGGRFKSKFGGAAKDVFAPIAGLVAGAAVVGLFKDAISGASDLAESGNKVKVIFGEATGEVDKFASQGAKRLGQTKLEVLNAASSFGVFGKAAGLGGHDLADFSDKLAGLSTDLASFFNTDPSQAVEAVAAGLRGESEPLRQFGVLLDDATLRQEAMRQGLIATTKQALTPQQRVLAAYQVILRQTKDAQGDFVRTSGGLANQQRILTAQWSEMKTELGTKLLPAATATVRMFNNGVLPAMSHAGGAVSGAVGAFNSLPSPIKAATGALVAFKTAQAVGLTGKIADSANAISTAFGNASVRVSNFRAAFDNARGSVLQFGSAGGQVSAPVSRMSASFAGLRAATFGISGAFKGALGLVGGPWGAAFIAGTLVVTHFWQEHQKAKQRVKDFTATLDAETGAMTDSSRAFAAKALLESGALAASQRLGLSLKTVTDAALGNKAALASVTAQMAAKGPLDTKAAADAITLHNAIGLQTGVVQQAAADQKLLGAAQGTSAAAQDKSTTATGAYVDKVKAARDAIRGLLDAENKRRNANLGILGDQIALNQAVADARKEAGKGKATLDLTTQAGRDNAGALRDLADAWNGSAGKVKNAKGAYAEMRQNFIDVAIKMGDTRSEAEKLANKILDIPRKSTTDITTPGMKPALKALREARKELEAIHNFSLTKIVITAQGAKNKGNRNTFATGGMIGGRGSGTSDSNLIFASRGEFMQRKAAVDYYGADFMAALNNLQVPRFARGGPIGPVTTSSAPMGQHISGTLGIDRDGIAYIYGVARSEADAAAAQRVQGSRMTSLDGIPR